MLMIIGYIDTTPYDAEPETIIVDTDKDTIMALLREYQAMDHANSEYPNFGAMLRDRLKDVQHCTISIDEYEGDVSVEGLI